MQNHTKILNACFFAISLFWMIDSTLLSTRLEAQNYYDFGFRRITTIPVEGYENKAFDLAWTGGLNACQLHSFDLNFNGVNDLIIFDRHGNRLLTFLNNGSYNEYAFRFSPEYIPFFPGLEHWVQFIDFNNDGKKDIFTYTTGGIKVFKNISDTAIKFEQVTHPYLRSKYGSIETNLLVTNADYPAILDLDSDGDLDILTFWGLGSFLEKHSNLSQELFEHSDSLIYKKTSYCWGYFAESDESNAIKLDTCLKIKSFRASNQLKNTNDERHTGSTLLLHDMTGNGQKDLILGDIDYPGLLLLINGGTTDSAYITGLDTLFPSNTRAVNLFSFPVANLFDVDNDGMGDLLVSPFDPSLRRANHHQSVWFYRNIGSNEIPIFEFEREDIFQHRMIDVGAGALPVLTDFDGDGLSDMIVGNFGYNDTCYYDQFQILRCKYTSRLAYFKNTGTSGNPAFTMMDDDFSNLSGLGLRAIYPAFGDIDADGKTEMILGHENGNLLLFKDQSKVKGVFDYVLVDSNYQQIKVSRYSAPQLFDLNRDGLPDLVLGQENGKLSYYQNRGSATNPVFIKITDYLGGVNVTDPYASYTGRSIPCFFRDSQNRLKLFVGSESGKIFYFKDIEENLNGIFTLAEERLSQINEGIMTAPAVVFLTSSNYPDLIVGNYGGGLSFYKGTIPAPYGINNPGQSKFPGIEAFPNPASEHIILVFNNIDSYSVSVEVYDLTGRKIFHSENLNKPQTVISVNNWNNGLYFLSVRFVSNDGREWKTRKKVIVSGK